MKPPLENKRYSPTTDPANNTKKYVPGPLSEMEKGLEKFKSWYLKHLEISIS